MPRKTTPNVSEAATLYLAQRSRRLRNAVVQVPYQERSLLARLTASVGDCHVSSLEPTHFEDFFYGPGGLTDTVDRSGRSKAPCGPTTLGNYRNHCQQFLAFCVRRGWLDHPAPYYLDGIEEKSTRSNRERFRLSAAQIVHLMQSASDPRDRALTAFIADTACRISEAQGLRVRDVSFEKGEVYVTISKGRRQVVRPYPLTTGLERELRAWLTVYTPQGGTPDAYLFPAYHSSRFNAEGVNIKGGLNPQAKITNPRLIFGQLCMAAEIRSDIGDGWHTLRRSVARIYFDARGSGDTALRETQALLNHANAATTERYLGLSVERRMVDRVLRGNSFIVPDGAVTTLSSAKQEDVA